MAKSTLFVVAVAMAMMFEGCASSPAGAPSSRPQGAVGTPCGGSHDWPPNGYAAAPVGLTVEIVSGTTVRVRNDTDQPWVARVAAWEDLPCTGYMTATDSPGRDLAPHDTFGATVEDPGWGGQLRIGVEFWDHPCDDACTDAPAGFAYVDPVPLSDASATFCPGRTWPPYPLGGIPGITAKSTDRATIMIENQSGRTYYYRVSGWQLDQFETCRALGEVEVQRGPIHAEATEWVKLQGDWEHMDVPITIAIWDEPCGEACQREPIAAMQVERSTFEPASS